MFGLLRKKKDLKDYISFLDKVDEAYMQVFATKAVTRTLNSYMTRDLLVIMNRKVLGYGYRYFGAPKFRKTSWTLLDLYEDKMRILKEVTFGKVKVSGGISISVASDYSEIWMLDYSGKVPMISGIEEVVCD